MSNLERSPRETLCGGRAGVAVEPVRELQFGHSVALGGPRAMTVTRTLPNRTRRMVGAWCFVDHFGPTDLRDSAGMQVPPHPHTGLQTVSWLVEGEILHRDSVGHRQLITPGRLNLMTAGQGISHSEESPAQRPPTLHGVQLWTALPDRDRRTEPHFESHADLPVHTDSGLTLTVFMGEIAGQVSPAQIYSPLVGAEAALAPGTDVRLALQPGWEYAALGLTGAADVDGVRLAAGALLYLGLGRDEVSVRAEQPTRLLIIGGEPFAERIVMWWNFVGRDHDDIVAARTDWMAADPRFGTVHGYGGDPLAAPALPSVRFKPRGRER